MPRQPQRLARTRPERRWGMSDHWAHPDPAVAELIEQAEARGAARALREAASARPLGEDFAVVVAALLAGRIDGREANASLVAIARNRVRRDCSTDWYAGLTCDHLYPDCPNRKRGETSLRRCGWWEVGGPRLDPHGSDICGLCLHRLQPRRSRRRSDRGRPMILHAHFTRPPASPVDAATCPTTPTPTCAHAATRTTPSPPAPRPRPPHKPTSPTPSPTAEELAAKERQRGTRVGRRRRRIQQVAGEGVGLVRLLDLFCGAGGAAMGYHRAGFDEIVGVDITPQLDYPFTCVVGDALDYLAEHWRHFDAIHASPPCQASTALTKGTNKGREYVQLIPETRRLLRTTGLPTRHRERAGLRPAPRPDPVRGDVRPRRHPAPLLRGPASRSCSRPTCHTAAGSAGGATASTTTAPTSRSTATAAARARWPNGRPLWASTGPSDRKAIAEAIPPAYTAWIGWRLLRHLEERAA